MTDLSAAIARAGTPLAAYLDRFGQRARPLWDEIAAASWIDPTVVTHAEDAYIDVNLDRGASYGDTLSWTPGYQPGLGEQLARVEFTLDVPRFSTLFTSLLSK